MVFNEACSLQQVWHHLLSSVKPKLALSNVVPEVNALLLLRHRQAAFLFFTDDKTNCPFTVTYSAKSEGEIRRVTEREEGGSYIHHWHVSSCLLNVGVQPSVCCDCEIIPVAGTECNPDWSFLLTGQVKHLLEDCNNNKQHNNKQQQHQQQRNRMETQRCSSSLI